MLRLYTLCIKTNMVRTNPYQQQQINRGIFFCQVKNVPKDTKTINQSTIDTAIDCWSSRQLKGNSCFSVFIYLCFHEGFFPEFLYRVLFMLCFVLTSFGFCCSLICSDCFIDQFSCFVFWFFISQYVGLFSLYLFIRLQLYSIFLYA